ncbi:unnamed protein product, partial [Brassica rapa]
AFSSGNGLPYVNNTDFVMEIHFGDKPCCIHGGVCKDSTSNFVGRHIQKMVHSWMVTFDPHSIMKGSVVNKDNRSSNVLYPTSYQGHPNEEFFSSKLEFDNKKIPCITCPCKPEGSMFTMLISCSETKLFVGAGEGKTFCYWKISLMTLTSAASRLKRNPLSFYPRDTPKSSHEY